MINKLRNKCIKLRNTAVRGAARTTLGATVMVAGMTAAYAHTAIGTALIAKIGELETWAYTILAISLVAFAAIKLVKKFAKSAT